jgi:hypothetical protein
MKSVRVTRNSTRPYGNIFVLIFMVFFMAMWYGSIFTIFKNFQAPPLGFRMIFILAPLFILVPVIVGIVVNLINTIRMKKAMENNIRGTAVIEDIKTSSVVVNGVRSTNLILRFNNLSGEEVRCKNVVSTYELNSYSIGRSVPVFIANKFCVIDLDELSKQDVNRFDEAVSSYRCECGTYVDSNLLYCPNCGRPVVSKENSKKEEKYCPQCGGKVGSDDAFCKNCGAKLDD